MQKAYRLICYSIAKYTRQVLLIFLKMKNTKHKNINWVSFFFLSFFFFSDTHNLQTIWCMRILCIPHDCSETGHVHLFSGLGWRTSYDWWPPTSKLSPTCIMFSLGNFWGFCSTTPGDKFARSLTSFLYLLALENQFGATEDARVHLDTFRMSAAWWHPFSNVKYSCESGVAWLWLAIIWEKVLFGSRW